jgi:hypothetical protein
MIDKSSNGTNFEGTVFNLMEVVSNYFPAEFEENQGNIRIARFSSEN